MGYHSKNIRTVVKMIQCRGRPNLSGGACQKSCEIKPELGKLWAEKDQLLYGSFRSSCVIKIVLSKHFNLIMRIINVIINMEDIRQERSNKIPILKLNKRLK